MFLSATYKKLLLRSSEKLHFSLDPDEPELLGGSVPVVKEQLVPRLDVALGKDADPVVPVDLEDFGVAVGVDGMVGEPDLVALPCCVHHELVVEVE